MATTRFLDVVYTILDVAAINWTNYGKKPKVIKLYEESIEGIKDDGIYLESDRNSPVQAFTGHTIYRPMSGTITITSINISDLIKMYDDVISLLNGSGKSWENLHEREPNNYRGRHDLEIDINIIN